MNSKNKYRFVMILVCLGLLLGSGGLGYRAAKADGVDVIYYSLSGSRQSFLLSDDDGNIRTGTFWANATGDDNGLLQGQGELVLLDETIQLTFSQLVEVIYDNGHPVGVELTVLGTDNAVSATIGFLILSDGSIRAVYNDGHRHTFDVVGQLVFW